MSAEPDHGDGGQVQHEHHRREHQRHQLAGTQRDVEQSGVRDGEPLPFLRIAHERADDPDAGDLLPQHPVDDVNTLLHLPEQRPHPGDDQHQDDAEQRHGDQQQGRQRHVLPEREDDPADAHDRRGQQQGERHDRQHLDLLHVVGRPGDQRRGADLVHLAVGELQHLAEDPLPDVTAKGHRDLGAEVDRADRTQDPSERDDEHPAASDQDVVRVVGDHAVVDDFGVQRRQVERGNRLRELEHQQQRDRLAVLAQEDAQQADQHRKVLAASMPLSKPALLISEFSNLTRT